MQNGSLVSSLLGLSPLQSLAEATRRFPDENFVMHRGRRVYVQDHGDGPALVLLHGFAASSYSFHRLVPRLASRFRVITLDWYGFGYTERPDEADGFGMDSQIDLISTVMAAKGLERAIVGGQSFGATLAMWMAQRDAGRVEGLVLISPVSEFGEAPRWTRYAAARRVALGATRMLLSRPERFRSVLANSYHRPGDPSREVSEAYRKRLLVEGFSRAFLAFTAGMGSGARLELEPESAGVPALVLAGRHDRQVSLESCKNLAKRMGDAPMEILEGSAHSSPEEEPDAVADAIRRFAGA